MTPPALDDTLAELKALCAFFGQAEETIKNGGSVDMTPMDARIGAVCQKVQGSLPENQQIYLPELATLLNLLDACELAIRSMQKEPEEPTNEESGHADT